MKFARRGASARPRPAFQQNNLKAGTGEPVCRDETFRSRANHRGIKAFLFGTPNNPRAHACESSVALLQ